MKSEINNLESYLYTLKNNYEDPKMEYTNKEQDKAQFQNCIDYILKEMKTKKFNLTEQDLAILKNKIDENYMHPRKYFVSLSLKDIEKMKNDCQKLANH